MEVCVRFLGMNTLYTIQSHTLLAGYLGYFQFSPIINNVELIILVCKPLVISLIIPPSQDELLKVELHNFNKCTFFYDLDIAKMVVRFRLL